MGNDISFFSTKASNDNFNSNEIPHDNNDGKNTEGKSQPQQIDSLLHKRKREESPKQNKKRKKEKNIVSPQQKPWGVIIVQSLKKDSNIELTGKKFRIGFKKDSLVYDQNQVFDVDVKRICDIHLLPNSQVVLGPADENDVQIRLNDNYCPRFLNLLNSGDSISIQVNTDVTHHFDLVCRSIFEIHLFIKIDFCS